MQRVVFVRSGALGDSLLTLPTLRSLRLQRPDITVSFIGHRQVLPLVLSSGLADSVYPHDLAAWSVVFDVNATPDDLAAALLTDAVTVRWHNISTRAPTWSRLPIMSASMLTVDTTPRAFEHISLTLASALQPLGLTPLRSTAEINSMMPLLTPSTLTATAADYILADWSGAAGRTVIAIHPGSGGAAKRWPVGRYSELAGRLVQRGYAVLVFGSLVDAPLLHQIVATNPEPPDTVRLGMDYPLEVVAAMLAHCAGFIGNDSGITHVSALCNCPTIAVFGPTDPATWAPLGRDTQVVRDHEGRIDQVSVADILAAVDALGV